MWLHSVFSQNATRWAAANLVATWEDLVMRIYARPSLLLLRQILFDLLVVAWIWGWWKLSALTEARIADLAAPADKSVDALETIGAGIAQAGAAAGNIPLVGEQVQRPINALSTDVTELMHTASAQADATRQTAASIGFWMFLIPALLAASWFLWRKYRYARATARLARLAAMPGGEVLLAWRAVNQLPLNQLAYIPNVVPALLAGDAATIQTLSNLARMECGMGPQRGNIQHHVTNV